LFDLATLDTRVASEDGVIMPVRHPTTDDPLLSDGAPITLRVCGQDSRRYREVDREHTDRRFKRMGRGGNTDLSAKELELERLERVVSCTLGWENVYLDNQPLSFSQENALELYKRLPWLVEQVNRFVQDRGNFLKASSAS
jgi:hypothetical protein